MDSIIRAIRCLLLLVLLPVLSQAALEVPVDLQVAILK